MKDIDERTWIVQQTVGKYNEEWMRDHSLLFRREFVLLYELALTGLYVNTKHRVGNIKKNHTYYPYRPLAENYSYNMN